MIEIGLLHALPLFTFSPNTLSFSLSAFLFELALIDTLQKLLLFNVSVLLCLLHLLFDSLFIFVFVPIVWWLIDGRQRFLRLDRLYERVQFLRSGIASSDSMAYTQFMRYYSILSPANLTTRFVLCLDCSSRTDFTASRTDWRNSSFERSTLDPLIVHCDSLFCFDRFWKYENPSFCSVIISIKP